MKLNSNSSFRWWRIPVTLIVAAGGAFATYRLLNLYEEAQLARTDPRDGQAGMYIIASLFFRFAAFLLLLIVVPYCLMRYAARQAKRNLNRKATPCPPPPNPTTS